MIAERRIKSTEVVEGRKCTIVHARYGGLYSGGTFHVWPMGKERIPHYAYADDTTCAGFWAGYSKPVGKGGTPDEAIANLKTQLK